MNDVASPTVAAVAVSPPAATIAIGARVPLTAIVRDSSGDTISIADVHWSVRDAAIATISDDGVVTGVAAGSTQVAASAGGQSGVASITVAGPSAPPSVASVAIAPSKPPAIAKNGVVTLTASLEDAAGQSIGAGRTLTWATSDPSIASVTPKAGTYGATVKGNKAGTTTITATSEGKSASVTITVKD